MPLTDAVADIRAMMQILHADVKDALSATEDDVTGTHRRQYVRAVVTLFDATSYHLKLFVREAHATSLTPQEHAYLYGYSVEVGDDGLLRERRLHTRLLADIRASFAQLNDKSNNSHRLPVEDRGWAALIDTVRVRNRITHPRTPGDLDVSDDEVKTAQEAQVWFTIQVVEAYLNAAESAQMKINSLMRKEGQTLGRTVETRD